MANNIRVTAAHTHTHTHTITQNTNRNLNLNHLHKKKISERNLVKCNIGNEQKNPR